VTKTTPFDASEYLDSEVMMAEYLTVALEDENPEVFVSALGNVAKAKGMAQIAKDAGLSRESLYKSLNGQSKPEFDTVRKVLAALGVKLVAEPINDPKAA